MKFVYGKHNFRDFERGQEQCYLLTNGIGGFSSLTMIGSKARGDHALLMAALKAPNRRYQLIGNVRETLCVGDDSYVLSAQQYVNRTKNEMGFLHLNSFQFDGLPQWTYQAGGVEVIKTVCLGWEENTVGIRYRVIAHGRQNCKLLVSPLVQFAPKGKNPFEGQTYQFLKDCIISEGIVLYFETNGRVENKQAEYSKDLYFEQDARDGRDAVGTGVYGQSIVMESSKEDAEFYLIYSMTPYEHSMDEMMDRERERQQDLCIRSGISDEVGLQLVTSASQFISYRESTKGDTILAGYPFFEDWGRDTMIALPGLCLATGQFERAKRILRTYLAYQNRGLLPNLFPEGLDKPLYNTADAALLFINAVYEYYLVSKDNDFVLEAFPVMEEIIEGYRTGSDYHIKMDEDGLIMAGSGLEQVTWMDVRIGDILPTPRHGKSVEINAYWYNALKVMEWFSLLFGKDERSFQIMADQTKTSFCEKFWNPKEGCLKDVLSSTQADGQIRCNQIFAVSMPFCMLGDGDARRVIEVVFEKLYTPYGLRTLSKEDADFHRMYEGSQFSRDMAYHQGTVWPYLLGAYYLSYLRFAKDKHAAKETVRRQLEPIWACLYEGCIGQIAEVYDGGNPTVSKGCFAQAWSVGEVLRVYKKLEE